MITSKLTSRARTTIPHSVRAALNLAMGDVIAYEIQKRRAVLTKAGSDQSFDPFLTFHEWNSEADERAYAALSLK